MALNDLIQFLIEIHPEIPRLIIVSIIVASTMIVYKLLSRSITRLGKRLELDAHIQNTLRLILRVLTLLVLSTIIFTVYELPTTIFVGSSALIGAAVGFGSSQTINNIVAGFYVIVARPFKIKDYVKIGDVEGQVEEISINYTKLYTPSFNLLLVPNVQVMNSRIINCTHEGLIKYTFSLTIPYGVSNDDFVDKCIKPAIEEFNNKYQEKQLRSPEYFFETSLTMGRTFKFRIFIPRGEAKTLYVLQPELASLIMSRWDIERVKVK
ncbi:mechanosensitive ion channel [Candidatus Bathyarchaeota archaeon]|nr:mechanosensitive ion channel [Candidatus Bathyarchaeota archaeon]